jgi:hypothetical protein
MPGWARASNSMRPSAGATPEGRKELVGLVDGVRESAQSWRELLVMTVARTQHHAMLAKANRLLVPVGRDVLDGQRGHCNPQSMS